MKLTVAFGARSQVNAKPFGGRDAVRVDPRLYRVIL
jgi:hypothetical protein